MPPLIRTPVNMFREVEKRLHYKWWDKGRERSNRAAQLHQQGTRALQCVMRHDKVAYSGPPYDAIRAYVCLDCHAAACEPEIRDRGYQFEDVPDWIMDEILDLDLQRQARGNTSFGLYTGR